MKTRLATTLAVTLLIVPAAMAQTTPGLDRAVKAEMSDGKLFALTAASSDLFEVESSKAALAKADRSDVKAFAEHMVSEHAATTAKLMAAAAADGIGVVSPPDSKYAEMIKVARQVKGGDFNLIYANMQVMAHQQAVALFEAYAENGTSTHLKAFAAENIATLKQHLADAETLVSK